jgi:hypothetical protein
VQQRHVRVRLPAVLASPVVLITLVFSLGFFFFSAQLNARIEESMANSLIAEGKVVDVIQRTVTRRGEQQTFYYLVFEFQTAQGETVRFESSEGSNQIVSQLGDTVRVFYNPNAPQEAFVDSPALWLAPRLFMGVGGFIAFLSVLAVLNGLLKLGGLLGMLGYIFIRQQRGG